MTPKLFYSAHPDIPMVRSLDTATALMDRILERNEGQTVLVVGHSDTVPELIGLLGGPSLPVINDCEFDNLFVLVRHSATRVYLTKLKYGEPTPPCPES